MQTAFTLIAASLLLPPANGPFFCQVRRVVDGDTFVADIQLPLSVTLRQQRIRVLGMDAPELRSGDGPKARQRAQELLGREAVIFIYRRDSFGRVLAVVFVRRGPGWQRLDKLLIKEHLAKPFQLPRQFSAPQRAIQ